MTSAASTEIKIAPLADRGVVAVSGEDAGKLLQGLITNDMALLGGQAAIHAGLLSPQGKILFEFFVVAAPDRDGFLLETARERAGDLAKRLGLYKLRAKVTIRDASSDYAVFAAWGPDLPDRRDAAGAVVFADPRLPALGQRILAPAPASAASVAPQAIEVGAADYHARRIGLGVPEGGRDYPAGDAFPHEALFDQLHGVSFSKGCFVGQEVVSRMEHRGTARKRVVPVVGAAALPVTGSEIRIGDVAIGTLGSVAGTRGLALLRLDRAAEAIAKGMPLTAGGVPITIELPPFATFSLAAAEAPA